MLITAIFLLIGLTSSARSPDQFTINLDLPAQKRYHQLALTKAESIKIFLDHLKQNKLYNTSFTNTKKYLPIVKHLIQKQFYLECLGIAKAIKRDVSQLIVFNYMYQLGAYKKFCTSIPVQIGQGDYFLARNLDYGFQKYLANNSVKLTYVRNMQPIFQTIGHAGLIGAHTGIRLNGYSVTLNQRVDSGLNRTLEEIFLHRSENVPYLLQKTFRTATNVEEAFRMLLNTRITAPVYFILNGPQTNILIERQRVGARAFYRNNDYIVQTNTDVDKPDPDTRRDIAQQKMRKLKQSGNITRQNVWNILTTKPNMNILTLITVMIDTSANNMTATVWA